MSMSKVVVHNVGTISKSRYVRTASRTIKNAVFTTYNWETIEQDYLASHYVECSKWWREMYGNQLVNPINNNIRLKLSALTAKKKKREINRHASNMLAINNGVIEVVKTAKTSLINELQRRLEPENSHRLTVAEIGQLHAMLRLELGETSKITEQVNKNINTDIVSLTTDRINSFRKNISLPAFAPVDTVEPVDTVAPVEAGELVEEGEVL